MRPAGLVTMLNDIWFRDIWFRDIWFRTPALAVELGSGVSTIVTARLLRQLGTGQLLAVERTGEQAVLAGPPLRPGRGDVRRG